MKKLIGQIGVESSGETINVSFYNAPQGLEVVSSVFNIDTNEVVVTLNQNILDSNIVTKRSLGNENNRILHICALNQTQMNILITDFEGTAKDNINWSYFEIDYIEETEYTAFELSKITHAKSILYGSGSEKLAEIANNL